MKNAPTFRVYRTPAPGSEHAHPVQVCRVMSGMVSNYRSIILAHYRKRNKVEQGRYNVRNWIAAFRRDMQACGWNMAAIQSNKRAQENE